jgi:putative ABC transport system permease protein
VGIEVKLIVAGIAIIILLCIVMFLITLVRMMIVSVVQWRDFVSVDRWTEVLITIGRNKLRTALTTISVAWGIFVLVLLLGLGNGLNQGAQHQFARDATNGVWVSANKTSEAHGGYDVGRRIQFDNRDYERVKGIKGVENPMGQFFIRGSRFGGTPMMTKRGGKASTFQINAVHHTALALETHEMVAGRFLSELDDTLRRKSAVVGQPLIDFLFKPGEQPIGEWIEVAGVPFQIVGIFKNSGGAEQERQLYIPVATAQLAFNGADHLGMIAFTVGNKGPAETQKVIDEVVGQLAERHNFAASDKQAVRVQNNVEGFSRFQTMFMILSVFVTVIGLGSLAAGVVGVSNIMMIAVKERTKEIGVRKALGATPSSVIFMIIQESVFLTGIAGLLGLAAGVGALGLLTTTVDPRLITLGLQFAGVFAGAAVLVVVAGLARLFRLGIAVRVAALIAIVAALCALAAGAGFVANIAKNDFILNPSISMSVGIGATLFLVLTGAFAGYFPARAAARINPIHALRDE